ncbi:MAG TPA: hypothetical protein PK149_00440 [Flavobacteriales bacterium]|nr:hypothetical protein [Flavobacteriales bacterium]
MADSFDLLDELGDEKKVNELKARIQKKKASDVISKLDSIESEIESAASNNKSSEDIVSGIINAKFESLNGDVESTEKDLQELMLHLRAMLDSCGGEFANLQELNKGEQGLVSGAKAKLQGAETELEEAKAMGDAWNILFGYKNSKVRSTTKQLDAAEQDLKQAEQDANRMYRERLKNADIGESLNRIISQVQGLNGVVEDMILEVEKQIDALKNRKELAFETKEKAARVMESRKAELENLEALMKMEEKSLEELANNSPEYTEQQKKVADLRERRAEVKGKFNIALGIFQSKERFVDQIVIHLEAQTITKNNLKQLIGQLKSDTEERVTTYESGLQLIRSATAQEAASIYEEAGVKTDQKITEIAAKVFVSSERDRIDRVKKHPDRMTELHKVLVAMAEATAQFKAKDAEIIKAHSNKFGIDVSETFSSNHEGGTGTGGTPVTPKKDGGVNDLL